MNICENNGANRFVFLTISYSKTRSRVTPGAVTECQLKYVGKTAGKDPVSTGLRGAGFRVSGMLTVFWTASTLL